jgi:hypothetical protein
MVQGAFAQASVACRSLYARIVRPDEALLILIIALSLAEGKPSLTPHTLSRTDFLDGFLEPVLVGSMSKRKACISDSQRPLTVPVSADSPTN